MQPATLGGLQRDDAMGDALAAQGHVERSPAETRQQPPVLGGERRADHSARAGRDPEDHIGERYLEGARDDGAVDPSDRLTARVDVVVKVSEPCSTSPMPSATSRRAVRYAQPNRNVAVLTSRPPTLAGGTSVVVGLLLLLGVIW